MVLGTHQCHFGLLWARDKHWHHDELLFHVEPWWKIVNTKSHRPSAMTTVHLTKRIHAIRTQTETFISRIQIKFRVRSIYFSPLRSAGCLNIESFLRSSLCHRINLALSLFLNRRFKRGIIGEYHMTFAGTLFRGGSPSTSPGSSFLIL